MARKKTAMKTNESISFDSINKTIKQHNLYKRKNIKIYHKNYYYKYWNVILYMTINEWMNEKFAQTSVHLLFKNKI